MKTNNNSKRNLVILISVLSVLIVALVAAMLISGLGNLKEENSYTTSQTDGDSKTEENEALPPVTNGAPYTSEEIAQLDGTKISVEMSDGQTFEMEVFEEVAPKTVENFVSLVKDGFYDGLTFHRVIEGFMAQGGDPQGTGFGGSDETIVGEFSSNGYENRLSHQRGVVSMARSGDPDSASSQFFICYDDATFLDGDYAAFGIVTEGMEVVDTFLSAGTDEDDKPLKDVRIKTMKVVE